MSEAAERRIEELEKEIAALQEMIFGILMEVAEPVGVNISNLKRHIVAQTHGIDAELDKENDLLVCQLVQIR